MRLPFRFRAERPISVRLYVHLGFHSGRLADLVQLLAHSDAIIRDLEVDRSLYHVGMPERSAEVAFLVKSAAHRDRILRELRDQGFTVRELIDPRSWPPEDGS